MNALLRKDQQNARDAAIRKEREGKTFLIKGDSLFQRAKKLKIATDLWNMNRDQRRREIKKAVTESRKSLKKQGGA